MFRWLFLALAVCLLAPAGRAFAQGQNTGTILGTVTDPGGLVIPNASVTVADPTAGLTRTVTTNKSGDFSVPSLPVGTYIVTVTAKGFETYVEPAATVDADKSIKMVVKLTVGSAKDTVTVEAITNGVQTDNSTLQTTIPNMMVENLPIDGNNIVQMAALLPGVTSLNAPATNTSDTGGPTFSVSGSRNTQNLMLFDGLMWNNLFFNTGINYPPRAGLQEISVLLNNFKAQYGRNAGSVFNVVTKRGFNQIHGEVWEYLQNQMFNASDYLTQNNPKDNLNQFGFSIGGPIKRDKLYYQATFQDLIARLTNAQNPQLPDAFSRGLLADGVTPRPCITQGYTVNTCAWFVNYASAKAIGNPLNPTSATAPPASDAIANFQSAWYQAGNTGTSPCVTDLTTAIGLPGGGASMPNNEVPTDCLNPVMMNLYKHSLGLPTCTGSGASTTCKLLLTPYQPKYDINGLGRVDYIVNARHSIDARYDLIDADDHTSAGAAGLGVTNAVSTYEINLNNAVSNFGNIGETWVVTPNIVNTLRAGYKRYQTKNPPTDPTTWNDLGGNFVEPGPPVLPVVGVSNFFTLGSANQAVRSVINEDIEINEQLNWTKGNHNFQFGGSFLRLQYLNRTFYPGKMGFSALYSGNSISDAAMGLLANVQANSLLVQGGVNHSIFSYIQDDWRATSRLTLNLGIRYELPFQWYQPSGYSSTFIPGHQSTVFPQAIGGLAYPGDPGVLRSLVPTDFNGIAPRFGFAYDVFGNGRLALRGGFGMFFDAINADVVGVGEPFYFQFFKTEPPGGASSPLATFGTNSSDTRPNGNPYVIPSSFDPKNPQFFPPYTLFFPDRNFRTPYYEAFNLGFQQRVTRGGVLDVNYVGKLGRKQTIPYDQNPAIADCSGGYYQSNYLLYAPPTCPYLVPGSLGGTANSNASSEAARVRYTPFNYGGGGLVDFASVGTSNYNGLQAQYTQRGGRRLTLLASYTYSKFIDLQTQSQSISNAIPDVYNIASERGPADLDARHILNMGWIVTLPSITEGPAAFRAVGSNWIFGGRFSAHTGQPYNVTINNDTALDDEPNQRAQFLPGFTNANLPANRHRTQKIAEYFNTAAFTYPVIGTFSPMQRNSLRGPSYLDTDMNVGRYFPLTHIREGMRMLFRVDAFNIWNTVNLGNPNANFSCSTNSIQTYGNANFLKSCAAAGGSFGNAQFGTITSEVVQASGSLSSGRKLQFSATVYF